MKTTNRAHHKGGKNRSVPQVQTPNTISLIFISEKEGKEIAGIDLKPGEFEAIKKEASARGETLSAWLCRAINGTSALHPIPQETIARYYSRKTFNEGRFTEETFPILHHPTGDLHRDLQGRLFLRVDRLSRNRSRIERTDLRELSYREACDWIARTGIPRSPETLLAFHGINEPATGRATLERRKS